jgi:anti-sigma factor RsiW
MITCRELADFIDAYLENDLASDEQHSFDAHLRACPACVAYLATYEATIVMSKAAFGRDEDEVPADVPEQLVKAILASRRRD